MLQQYNHILVPVDGSHEAELAFKKSIAVSKRHNAVLHLVHVVDTRAFQNITSFDTTMIDEISDSAKKTLEKYVQDAHIAGVTNVDYSIEYGSPKTTIARDVPQNLDIDLIMLGGTGLNAVERLLIGSVTEYVTRTAVCDVLVVRTDQDNKPSK